MTENLNRQQALPLTKTGTSTLEILIIIRSKNLINPGNSLPAGEMNPIRRKEVFITHVASALRPRETCTLQTAATTESKNSTQKAILSMPGENLVLPGGGPKLGNLMFLGESRLILKATCLFRIPAMPAYKNFSPMGLPFSHGDVMADTMVRSFTLAVLEWILLAIFTWRTKETIAFKNSTRVEISF